MHYILLAKNLFYLGTPSCSTASPDQLSPNRSTASYSADSPILNSATSNVITFNFKRKNTAFPHDNDSNTAVSISITTYINSLRRHCTAI